MKTVWKFQLNIEDRQIIKMPKQAKVLCVQNQYNSPCIWALVESEAEADDRVFCLVGTGHPIEQGMGIRWQYIGSFQQMNGLIVWHLFETSL